MTSNSSPKIVFITGASSGIGKALALEFYRHGHSIVLFARRKDRLDAVADELRKIRPDGQVLVLAGDVTHRTRVHEAMQEAVQKLGAIDILINNAGAGLNASFETMDPKAFQDVFDLNVMGVLNCIQEVIPIMKAQKSGQIVNVTSIVGKRALPYRSAYCASKYAVEGLSESIRIELRGYGIEVIVARPSTTETEFFDVEPRSTEYVESTGMTRMPAEQAAREIYRGVMRHKRDITISFLGKVMIALNTISPRLVDFLVADAFKNLVRKK